VGFAFCKPAGALAWLSFSLLLCLFLFRFFSTDVVNEDEYRIICLYRYALQRFYKCFSVKLCCGSPSICVCIKLCREMSLKLERVTHK